MRHFLTLSATAVLALAQPTSPTGFGRMIYSATGAPGVTRGVIGPSTGGAGFGRMIYPGTGAPAAIRQGVLFGVQPPQQQHQVHGRSAIIPFPVFYGGGYYGAFDIPQASTLDDRDRRAPVIIINQAYQPEPVNPVLRDYSSTSLPPAAPRSVQTEVRGEPPSDDPTLYQIAMTDGSIFEAVGYWVEGDVLHYLTLEGNNNLATLDLVDRDRSLRLNVERKVAFKLPKRK